jgi:hypothetical protein
MSSATEVTEHPEKAIDISLSSVFSVLSGASVKLTLSCDLKGGHHGMTRLPCSSAGMSAGNRAM